MFRGGHRPVHSGDCGHGRPRCGKVHPQIIGIGRARDAGLSRAYTVEAQDANSTPNDRTDKNPQTRGSADGLDSKEPHAHAPYAVADRCR